MRVEQQGWDIMSLKVVRSKTVFDVILCHIMRIELPHVCH